MAEMAALYKALAAAQAKMEPALKGKTNPAFRTKYADLGAVQDACMDALWAQGFAVFQPIGMDDEGHYVETVFAHESGGTIISRVYLVLDKQNMQGLGSAITYARRYGLLSLAGIAPEDDDGNAAARRHEPPRTVTPEEVAVAISYINECSTADRLKTYWTGLYTQNQEVADHPEVVAAKDAAKARLQQGGAK